MGGGGGGVGGWGGVWGGGMGGWGGWGEGWGSPLLREKNYQVSATVITRADNLTEVTKFLGPLHHAPF